MSDQKAIEETLDRFYADRAGAFEDEAPTPEALESFWEGLVRDGWTRLSFAAEDDGGGGTLGDAATALKVSARHGAPLPLAEMTLIVGPQLANMSPELGSGPWTIGSPSASLPRLETVDGVIRLSGKVTEVPWARESTHVAAVTLSDAGPCLAVVRREGCRIDRAFNIAGEPRDAVTFDGVEVTAVGPPSPRLVQDVRRRGALARTICLVGAMERVVDMTVEYASQREQFGRPVAKFQAVRDLLARLAGELAASSAAMSAAVSAEQRGEATFAVHVAKARASEAAGKVGAIAHQVHGALGYTQEYALQRHTRRLWAWRDDYGSETEHRTAVTRMVSEAGADGLWCMIAGGE